MNTDDSKGFETVQLEPVTSSPKDEALASLETELKEARDSHLEERFIWVVLTVILVNALLFGSLNGFFAFGLLIIQIPLLIVFARKCGVDEAAKLFDSVLSRLSATPGE